MKRRCSVGWNVGFIRMRLLAGKFIGIDVLAEVHRSKIVGCSEGLKHIGLLATEFVNV